MGLVAGKDDSNSILLTKKVRMKKANARGGKLVVTVPNEESSSSRLKPPVTVSQPRKIVRLNRKTGKLLFSVLCYGNEIFSGAPLRLWSVPLEMC